MTSDPIELALPFAAALSLCALRWVPAVVLVPAFAGHALSGLVRTVLALAMALPAAPAVANGLVATPLGLAEWLGLAAKEAAIGIVLASLIATPFWAMEAAGTYLDYQRGGNPQALDPAASAEASTLGAMFQQALVVYLVQTGGLHSLLEAVWASYAVWPPLHFVPPAAFGMWPAVSVLLVCATRIALTLVFPYLLALGAIEVCFALLSRVNAKFPAYVAALPFKSVTLLLLVALTLPRLLDAAAGITAEHATGIGRLMDGPAPPEDGRGAAASTKDLRPAEAAGVR